MNESILKYFFISKRLDYLPNDPVARFHIGNGAILERINFLSDTSEKGLEQSLGFMVNYLYNLEEVEINHEKYVVDKKINTSKSLEKEFMKINTLVSQSMQQLFVLMVYKLLKLKVMKNLYYFPYMKVF